MPIRHLLIFVTLLAPTAYAQPSVTLTQILRSTYRIYGEGSNATCLIVRNGPASQRLLVTANHVLEKMVGDQATLQLRMPTEDDEFERTPKKIRIRRNGQDLWTRHPEQDVAVLTLPSWEIEFDSVAPAEFATGQEFQRIEPGQLVRCIGYPHAAHFDPIKEGFPLVRLGCISSYPIVPLERHPTFLVDFNTFEGDSGGVVVLSDESGAQRIVGTIHGQHFLDERFDLIYQKGQIRKRLGLSIIVNATSVIETIERHVKR